MHVWSNQQSVLHLFIFHVKVIRTLNKVLTTVPTKSEFFFYGFQFIMNEIRRDQLNFNILRKFLFYKVLSSTLFLLISLNCWGEVATLSCLFSFQQHPKLNSLLSVVNLYLKLSGYNCSIHKVLWTRNWWLGGTIIWNFNEH